MPGRAASRTDTSMSWVSLTLAADPGQREVLRQALADAVYYRDSPVWCPVCPTPDRLCNEIGRT
jgi:hypothetical protein